jgi:hypothetical protein
LSAIVILLSLAAGGWLVWWFVFGGRPETQAIKFDAPPRARSNFGGRDPALTAMRRITEAAPPGVYFIRQNEWSIRTPSVAGRIQRKSDKDTQFTSSLAYKSTDFVTPEQALLLRARNEVQRSAALVDALKLSAEQVAGLKKIAGPSGVQLDDQDRARLSAAMAVYLAAADQSPQSGPANAVVAAAEEIAKARLEATKQSLAARAEEVRAILTPQQIETLRQRQAQPAAARPNRP